MSVFKDIDQNIKEHLDAVFKEVEEYLGFKPKCYFAGGCIASIVLGQPVNDYDLWFESPEDFQDVNNRLYKSELKGEDFDLAITKSDFKGICSESKFATTLFLPSRKKIQFVQNRMGPANVLVPQFDFKHTHSYYIPGEKLSVDVNFIQSRTLSFVGSLDHPINTFERMIKFSKRGYYVSFECIQNLMLEIQKMSPEKIKGLEKHGGSL